MKRATAPFTLLMTLTLGLAVTSGQTKPSTSSTEATPRTDQLQRLVSAAKTPEDHHRIAGYYLQSAERLEQEAADHATLAKEYRSNPPRVLRRQGANRTLAATAALHCDDFITSARRAARAERALAAIHEKAAAEAAATP